MSTELDLRDERREPRQPFTWADVDAWLDEQRRKEAEAQGIALPPSTPEPLRIPPRQPVIWREMTEAETRLIQSIGRCRLSPASFEKRFIRSLVAQAAAERPLITAKQTAVLTRLAQRHRVQLTKLAPELGQVAPLRLGSAIVASQRNLPRMVIDAYLLLPGQHVFINTSKPVAGAPWFEVFAEPVSANLSQRKAMTRFFHAAVVTERVNVKGRMLRRPMVWRVCRSRLDKLKSFAARYVLEGTWALPDELSSALLVAADCAIEQNGTIPLPCGVQTPSVLPRLQLDRQRRASLASRGEEMRAGIPWEDAELHRENARLTEAEAEVRHG